MALFATKVSGNYDKLAYDFNFKDINGSSLNLSEYKKRVLVNKPITNSKEENKDYEYNYFKDNCSTKIGDIFNELLEEEIRNAGINLDNMNSSSFRQLEHQHVAPNSWGALGIDICLGSVIDTNITDRDLLVLPYNLKLYFDKLGNSNIKNGDLLIIKKLHCHHCMYS